MTLSDVHLDLETRVKVVCEEFLGLPSDSRANSEYQLEQILVLAKKCLDADKKALCNVLAYHCLTTGNFLVAARIWDSLVPPGRRSLVFFLRGTSPDGYR